MFLSHNASGTGRIASSVLSISNRTGPAVQYRQLLQHVHPACGIIKDLQAFHHVGTNCVNEQFYSVWQQNILILTTNYMLSELFQSLNIQICGTIEKTDTMNNRGKKPGEIELEINSEGEKNKEMERQSEKKTF